MRWNYRIVRYPDGGFGLHEVYYDAEGEIEGWTEDPISFVADDEEGERGIILSLAMAIRDAVDYPTLVLPEGGLDPADARVIARLREAQRERQAVAISRPDSLRILQLAEIGARHTDRHSGDGLSVVEKPESDGGTWIRNQDIA